MKQETKYDREKLKRKEKEKDDAGEEEENEVKQELKPDQKRVGNMWLQLLYTFTQ